MSLSLTCVYSETVALSKRFSVVSEVVEMVIDKMIWITRVPLGQIDGDLETQYNLKG